VLGWRLRKVTRRRRGDPLARGWPCAGESGRLSRAVSEAEPYLLHQQQQLPFSAFRTDLHYFEHFDFLRLPAFLNAIAQPLGAVNLAAGIDAHESFPAANRLLQRLLDAGLSQWDPDPRGATPMATQGEEE